MRKLSFLIGAAVLASATAAFAQPVPPDDRAYGGYPPDDQGGPGYQQQQQPYGGPVFQAPSAPPGAWGRPTTGSRLYSSQGEYQVQRRTITNGPIPDTPATRQMYPPLSRGGARTAPIGN